MLGAIAGDIAGSTREWNRVDSPTFPLFPDGSRFTDDTALREVTDRFAVRYMSAPTGEVP